MADNLKVNAKSKILTFKKKFNDIVEEVKKKDGIININSEGAIPFEVKTGQVFNINGIIGIVVYVDYEEETLILLEYNRENEGFDIVYYYIDEGWCPDERIETILLAKPSESMVGKYLQVSNGGFIGYQGVLYRHSIEIYDKDDHNNIVVKGEFITTHPANYNSIEDFDISKIVSVNYLKVWNTTDADLDLMICAAIINSGGNIVFMGYDMDAESNNNFSIIPDDQAYGIRDVFSDL